MDVDSTDAANAPATEPLVLDGETLADRGRRVLAEACEERPKNSTLVAAAARRVRGDLGSEPRAIRASAGLVLLGSAPLRAIAAP